MRMAISVPLLAAVLLSLSVSGLYGAPSRRSVSNECQGYVLSSDRTPVDGFYDALHISRKLMLGSVLKNTDDKVREAVGFYYSLERIVGSVLSEEINGDESVVGQALKEVISQLAKDACAWAVHNETEATLTVNCSNLTDISTRVRERSAELIETLYQQHLNLSTEALSSSKQAISHAVQMLPEIEDMRAYYLPSLDNTDIRIARKAWVATYVSPEYQPTVCSAT